MPRLLFALVASILCSVPASPHLRGQAGGHHFGYSRGLTSALPYIWPYRCLREGAERWPHAQVTKEKQIFGKSAVWLTLDGLEPKNSVEPRARGGFNCGTGECHHSWGFWQPPHLTMAYCHIFLIVMFSLCVSLSQTEFPGVWEEAVLWLPFMSPLGGEGEVEKIGVVCPPPPPK